jgi:hypothetical protein
MVQLVADGGKDGVDDPMEWIMAQADPCGALQAWVAGGCLPVGDDFLVVSTDPQGPNPTYVMDFSSDPSYDPAVYDGNFVSVYVDSSNPAFGGGVGLYTRFFTAEHPTACDWYGTAGIEDIGQPFQFYQLDQALFPTYNVHGGVADQHIECPEPASMGMVLGGIGLLLAFFRRKK